MGDLSWSLELDVISYQRHPNHNRHHEPAAKDVENEKRNNPRDFSIAKFGLSAGNSDGMAGVSAVA